MKTINRIQAFFWFGLIFFYSLLISSIILTLCPDALSALSKFFTQFFTHVEYRSLITALATFVLGSLIKGVTYFTQNIPWHHHVAFLAICIPVTWFFVFRDAAKNFGKTVTSMTAAFFATVVSVFLDHCTFRELEPLLIAVIKPYWERLKPADASEY